MEKRKRWTVLDVDEEVIELVRQVAIQNGYTTGLSLSLIVSSVKKAGLDEEIRLETIKRAQRTKKKPRKT